MLWLEQHGYIKDVKLQIGSIRFTAINPPNLPSYDEYSGTGVEFELDTSPVRDENNRLRINSSASDRVKTRTIGKASSSNSENDSSDSEKSSNVSEKNPWIN